MVSATVLKGYAPAEHSDASGHCLEAPTAEEGCVLRDDFNEAIDDTYMHTNLPQACAHEEREKPNVARRLPHFARNQEAIITEFVINLLKTFENIITFCLKRATATTTTLPD